MSDNKWSQPNSPPPPLFTGKKERDFVKQVNDEVIERVIGQTVLYYSISSEHTNFNDVYGEAIEKNFLNPIILETLRMMLLSFFIFMDTRAIFCSFSNTK